MQKLCQIAVIGLFKIPKNIKTILLFLGMGVLSLQGTSATVTAQDITITGVVSDQNGPLPGANIVVKGTTHGVVTDLDGKYSITIPNRDAVLVFSFVGFAPQEITVGQQTAINVTLAEVTKKLDEVVVVGYGVQRKVTLTGAVDKVEGDRLTRLNAVNTEKALQGLTPGITIIDRGGAPGGDDPNVYLRGVGTTGSTSPLVLVDGIEMSLSQIPAQDIDNVSILKDAASAAIYGSRAANGVILVTTKRGKSGQMTVSYDGSVGLQTRAVKAKAVGAREYMEMVNEASTNAGNTPIFSENDIVATENGSDPYNHPYVIYPNEVFKPDYVTEHNLSVTGGSDNGRYLASFNFLDQPGLTENTNYKRYNFRVNSDITVGKRAKASVDVYYRHIDRLWPEQLGEAQYRPWSMVPTVPIRYANGNYALDNQNDNPVASMDLGVVGRYDYQGDVMYGQAKLDYEVIKDLTLTGLASVHGRWDRNKTHHRNYKFYNANDEYVTEWYPQNGVVDVRDNNYQVTLRFLANYHKNFNKIHDFTVLYGMERISYRNFYSSGERQNLISDDLPDVGLGSASSQYADGSPYDPGSNDPNNPNSVSGQWGINSFFGRINYGFKDRYLFEFNIRADGSSRFADGHKWGVFPSASAAWRITEESFMKDLKFINNLKLRASWGQTGNNQIGYFMYLPQYGVESVVMNGGLVTGVRQSQMNNPDITWETVEQTDIGIDFNLMNNHIFGQIDYYIKDTKNILLNLAIPHFIGLDPPPQNVGVVRNTGVELMAGYQKNTGDFRFTVSFNYAYNRNKWIDRGGDDLNINGWNVQKLDSPLNSYYIFKTDGLIANSTELADYTAKYKADPRGLTALKPGDIKFVDANGDGTIDDEDRVVYEPNIPKSTYGLNFTATYSDFDLTLFLQGATGSRRYVYGEWYEGPSYEAFTGIHFRDRWTPQNEDGGASVPRLEAASNRNAQNYNSFYLQNNAYLRLKNIQVGYTIPTKIVEKVKIQKLRVYVSASNLFTLTKLDQGLDPEAPDGRTTSFPQLRIMTFGVNLVF